MSSLGPYLRGLREAKGMSLDDIARSTRVGRRHLEALESDTFGELPAPVFVKGFIRAYCEFLECSPEKAVDLYRETTGEPASSHGPMRPLVVPRSRRAGPLAISIALFVALGASLFALRFGLQPSPKDTTAAVSAPARDESPKIPAPGGSGKAGAIAAATPTAAQAPAAMAGPAAAAAPASSIAPVTSASPLAPAPPVASGPPVEAKPGNHRLVVRALEPTWLRVQVDEGQVAEELLQAGAVREWSAARRFTLTVGNAGGVEMDLNGKRMPPLGARGEVIQRLVLPHEPSGAGS
ncbi:MAG TPA: RodZ domain-containing protein [Methylomirabilota bacterium]